MSRVFFGLRSGQVLFLFFFPNLNRFRADTCTLNPFSPPSDPKSGTFFLAPLEADRVHLDYAPSPAFSLPLTNTAPDGPLKVDPPESFAFPL